MPVSNTQIQQLYVAYFARPADPVGLNFYATSAAAQSARGVTDAAILDSISSTFALSAEYTANFTSMSAAQTVNQVYQNLFSHSADLGGLLYWSGKLQDGSLTVSNIVRAISQSAVGANNVDGTAFSSKVAAAESFTASLTTAEQVLGYSGTSAGNLAKSFISSVNSAATLATAIVPATLSATVGGVVTAGNFVAGQPFTLTTGLDTGASFTGGTANDTFSSTIRKDTATAAVNTLNAGDNLTGGAGTDTLSITASGTDVTAGSNNISGFFTTGIENLSIQNASAATLSVDATSMTGVTAISSSNNAAALTVTGLAAPVSLSLTNTNVAMTLGYGVGVTVATATTDSSTITLNAVGAATATTITSDGIETINLVTASNASGASTARLGVVSNTLKTLNVSGDKALVVTPTFGTAVTAASASTVATVNASTMTGALNVDTSALAGQFVNITGGTANDTISINLLSGDTTIAGGDGVTDTLNVGAGGFVAATSDASTNFFRNVSGIEKVGFSTALTTSVNLATATGISQVVFGANTNTGTITGLASGASFDLASRTGNTLTGTLTNATISTTDSATVIAGTSSTTADLNVGSITLSGVETLNISSLGAASSTGVTTLTVTDADVTTIVVSGSERLALTAGGTALTSLSAAGMTAGGINTTGVTFKGTGAVNITGGAGADTLTGGNSNDVISGGDGNDTIADSLGNDTMLGGNGADTITGGTGNDNIDAGAGIDRVQISSTVGVFTLADTVSGGADADTLVITGGNALADAAFTNVSQFETLTAGTGEAISVTLATAAQAAGFTAVTGTRNTAGDTSSAVTVTTATGFTSGLTVNLGTGTTTDATDTINASATAGALTVKGSALNIQTGDTFRGSTAGTADEIQITASGDATAAQRAVLGAGFLEIETVTIVANATDATTKATLTIASDLAVAATKTLNVNAAGLTNGLADFSLTVTSELDGKYSVTGGAGNDTITLTNAAGADTIDGGLGNDIIDGGAGNDSITGGLGADSITGGTGTNTLTGGDGIDTIQGGSGIDRITGDAGNDSIVSGGGNDIIDGGEGNDTITMGAGAESISGAGGNDIFIVNNTNLTSTDTLAGGDGVLDTITLSDNTQLLDTAFTSVTGVELITASAAVAANIQLGSKALAAGINTITAVDSTGVTVSTLTTTYTGALTVNLGATADGLDSIDMSTSAAAVTVKGGELAFQTADVIKGGTSTGDVLSITADAGSAVLGAGVTGFETITILANATTASTAASLTLNNANTAATKTVVIDASGLTSTTSAFTLAGVAELDGKISVTGSAGDDNLAGGSLADTIIGGTGNDTIQGNGGADELTGGTGVDQFTWTAVAESTTGANRDTVKDFTSGTDKLLFTIAGTGKFLGNVSSDAAARLSLTGTANDAVYNTADKLLYIDVNGDGAITALDYVVQLDNVATLQVADFNTTAASNFNDTANSAAKAMTLSAVADTGASFTGGAGNDTFTTVAQNLGNGDVLVGGAGTDTLELSGAGTFTLTGVTLTTMEAVSSTATTGTVVIVDGTAGVISGATLTVSGTSANAANVTLRTGNAALDLSNVTLTNVGLVTNTALTNTTFTLGANSLAANITSVATDTIAIGALAPTGTYVLGAGDTITATTGASIAGMNAGASTGAATLSMAGTVSMTAVQHNALAFTAGGGADAITLSGAGNVTADTNIETYNLGATGRTLTIGGTSAINVTGGAAIDTIIVTGAQTGAFNLAAGANVISAATGASLSNTTLTAVGGTVALTIATGGSITTNIANHALFITGGVTAAGTEQITLSDVGTATGAPAVETYVLANGTNSFTLGAVGQIVTGGTGADTLIVGALAVTSTSDLAAGANVVSIANGGNISAATFAATGGTFTLNFDGAAAVTMNATQAGATLSATGTNTVTLSNAITGAATLNAAVETFNLFNATNSVTLGTAAQNINGGTGADTVSFTGVTTPTGTIALGSGTNVISSLATGSVLNNTITAAAGTASITLASGASVTMSAANYNLFNTTGITAAGTEQITLSSVLSAAEVLNANVETFVLAAGGNSVTLGTAAQVATGGAGIDTIRFGAFNPTGTMDLAAGANVVVLNATGSIAAATFSATGGSVGFNLDISTAATMNSAQAALIVSAVGTNAVTLSDAATGLTLNAAVESFTLFNGTSSYAIVGGAQTVLGAAAVETVGLSGTISGAIDLAGGANVSTIANGTVLSGTIVATAGTLVTTIASGGSATMTSTIHGLLMATTTIAAGGTNTITLTGAFSGTAAAAVENYVLANATNAFTFAAATAQGVTGGTGADTINVTLANLGATATTASLGTDAVTDRVSITNTSQDAGSAKITVSGFTAGAGGDQVRVIDTAVSAGVSQSNVSYAAVGAASNTAYAGTAGATIEIESTNVADFTDIANAGAIEVAILAALGQTTVGTYTVVLYSGTDAGIYEMLVGTNAMTAAGDITVELVAVLSNVGANALTVANFY